MRWRHLFILTVSIPILTLSGCKVASESEGPGLTGVLLGEDGAILPYVSVMACRADVCFYGDSGTEGRFTFRLEAPAAYLIKTTPEPSAAPRRSSPMVPVTLKDDALVDLGPVYVPLLPTGVSIGAFASGPIMVEAGDGLALGLDPSQLQLPPGQALTDVAAHRIPPSMIPAYPSIRHEEVIAVYALHPFAARSRVPIEVRVDSRIAAGTEISFRTIDDTDGRLSESVPGIATGEFLTTDPDHGILTLTHLLVTR